MKGLTKFVALGAVLAATSGFALADTIAPGSSFALSGNDSYTSSTITFGPSQLGAATDTGTTEITGTFKTYLTDGNPPVGSTVTFVSPLTYSQGTHTTTSSTPILTVTSASGTESFTFSISGYTADYVDFGGGNTSLLIDGTGTFAGSGAVTYTATPGSFIFSSQVVAGHATTTFSASAAATGVTPEPNSLILLGTGLIGAAGMVFSRRRNAASIL